MKYLYIYLYIYTHKGTELEIQRSNEVKRHIKQQKKKVETSEHCSWEWESAVYVYIRIGSMSNRELLQYRRQVEAKAKRDGRIDAAAAASTDRIRRNWREGKTLGAHWLEVKLRKKLGLD